MNFNDDEYKEAAENWDSAQEEIIKENFEKSNQLKTKIENEASKLANVTKLVISNQTQGKINKNVKAHIELIDNFYPTFFGVFPRINPEIFYMIYALISMFVDMVSLSVALNTFHNFGMRVAKTSKSLLKKNVMSYFNLMSPYTCVRLQKVLFINVLLLMTQVKSESYENDEQGTSQFSQIANRALSNLNLKHFEKILVAFLIVFTVFIIIVVLQQIYVTVINVTKTIYQYFNQYLVTRYKTTKVEKVLAKEFSLDADSQWKLTKVVEVYTDLVGNEHYLVRDNLAQQKVSLETAQAGSEFFIAEQPSWMVLITNKGVPMGVGFRWKNYILTAGHVANYCDPDAVTTLHAKNGKTVNFFIEKELTKFRDQFFQENCFHVSSIFPDVAFLRISDKNLSTLDLTSVRITQIQTKSKISVSVFGFRAGDGKFYLSSGLATTKNMILTHTASTGKGHSGGAIIQGNARAEHPIVIGLHTHGGEHNQATILDMFTSWLTAKEKICKNGDEESDHLIQYFNKYQKEFKDEIENNNFFFDPNNSEWVYFDKKGSTHFVSEDEMEKLNMENDAMLESAPIMGRNGKLISRNDVHFESSFTPSTLKLDESKEAPKPKEEKPVEVKKKRVKKPKEKIQQPPNKDGKNEEIKSIETEIESLQKKLQGLMKTPNQAPSQIGVGSKK